MEGSAGRDEGIDAARTVACALVVLMHVNAYARSGIESWWPGGYGVAPFFCLTVPAFLIIAGFLQARPTAPSGAALGGRLRRLLLPFLSWNAILLMMGFNGARRSAGEVLVDLTTGVQHLYYLAVLAQLTVVYVLLRRLRPGGSGGRALLVAGAVSLATLTISDLALWSGRDALDFTEGWLRRLALPWAVFFFFGAWLRRRRPSLALGRGALALLAGATAGGYLLYEWALLREDATFGYAPRTELLLGGLPFQLLAGWLLVALLETAARHPAGVPVVRLLGRAARETYGIYLAHFAVLIALYAAWARTGVSVGALEVPALWAIVWLGSTGLVRAVRALPLPWLGVWLLGDPPSRRPMPRPAQRTVPGALAELRREPT